ncbi:NADPH-dependent FMN reductase [Arenibaculum pallidiluteum]|uniref:NADPH-dependent FMN reductase n=1 Tax=Arenibaculum pallidiluteum TaxID=2812559 RepID=UPI001B3BBDB1|nr:NAD(P)H-dependent oxidoreductase [Arenibaculum pallidiluteum]
MTTSTPPSTPIRVLGISGSQRKGSYNTALLHAARELAPAGMEIEIADIAPLPMYDDDVRVAGFPPVVEALRTRMRAADALLLVSPEYNRSVPAILKNAIDWASRAPDQPFDGKPVAIMTASPGALGGIMANHHLRQILVFLNGQTVSGPEVAIGDAKAKFDEQGRLTHQPTRDFVAAHLAKLAALASRGR